ncbi:MAG: TIGR02253 family HAD-type hydrolase [archaeon]
MIKAVFFDIDGTLYDSRKLADTARENAVKAMIEAGLEGNEKKILSALNSIVKGKGSNYDKHFDALLDRLEVEWNPEIIAAGVAAYHDTKLSFLRPYPETVPVLLSLRDEGYSLGIISNGRAVKQWEKLIRLRIHHFFDVVHVSETAGMEKPDAQLFASALREAGARAQDAVMVGDKPETDIKGAKGAGLRAILVDRNKKGSMHGADAVINSLSQLPSAIRMLK